MVGSLDGIRVLDLGSFVSCPFCGMLLADLGAEVIRVEKPTGGEDRFLGLLTSSGDSYTFVNPNRNKKDVSLNLLNEKGRNILNEMVKVSDVVIENLSPQLVKETSIMYDSFKKIKPEIIYARVTAFGPTGPYRHRIALDRIARAMSGAISISGLPDYPCCEPMYYVDYGTASLTAVGVLAALYHRERTGKGQLIDTSLLQTGVTYMAPFIAEWETGGKRRERIGNRGYWYGPYDVYETKDGRKVFLGAVTNSIWKRFCNFIGREDLVTDPRFNSEVDRFEHRDIIDPVAREWVASQTAEEVIASAEKIPVPCGMCYEQTEVAHDPQVKALEMLTEVPSPGKSGNVLVTNSPLSMSETPLKIERSYPAIGQHNEEIYCGLLGYNREDLTKLKEEGVI